MHITEYKRNDYDDVVGTFKKGFVVVSQFSTLPENLAQVDWNNYSTKKLEEPKCHTGQFLFGIETNGDLTKLMSIIDSSD